MKRDDPFGPLIYETCPHCYGRTSRYAQGHPVHDPWIPTSKRIPEVKEGRQILIACDVPEYLEHSRYRTAQCDSGWWITANGAPVDFGAAWVTHWCEITPPTQSSAEIAPEEG